MVAAAVMALADTRAAIGKGSAFHHPLPLSQPRAWRSFFSWASHEFFGNNVAL
jgi:hypothetical protein